MSKYLVIHSPNADGTDEIAPPSDLVGLAHAALQNDTAAKWLSTYMPASADDRIFTLWETDDPSSIDNALVKYHFLKDMKSEMVPVVEWGPESVLAASDLANAAKLEREL